MNNGLTIGIPVYNEKRLIERAIRSAAPQCERLIVGDNCSTDGTSDICKVLLNEYSNMEYFRHENNVGARGNWDFILGKASTPYIMYMGSHDYIDDGYASAILDAISGKPDVVGGMGFLNFVFSDKVIPVDVFNSWEGGMLADPAERVRDFLYSRAKLGWLAYGIIKTDVFRKCFTDDLPDYGIDVIFISRVLEFGKLRVVNGVNYYGWMREDAGEKADYLRRVSAKRIGAVGRLKMRNELRVAQYEMILGQLPHAGAFDRFLVRLQSMIRFGVFKTRGMDPLCFIFYFPVKIVRKVSRTRRWFDRNWGHRE